MIHRTLCAFLLFAAAPTSFAAAQSLDPMLFVANHFSADVSSYEVTIGGEVTPAPDSPLSPGQDSLSLAALTPDGSFLITTGSATSAGPTGAEVRGMRINPDGSLTLEPNLTTTVPQGPTVMTTAARDGRTFVYLFPFESIVYAFELVDGVAGPTLQPIPGQPFASPGFAYFGDAAATPDGHFLYVGKAFDAGLTGFAIAENGALTLLDMPALAAPDHFRAVAVSPDGQHLYAATHADVPATQTAHIHAYSIASDGLLTEVSGSPFTSSPVVPDRVSDMAITPAGDRLLALNFISQTLTLLTRSPDGSLTPTFQTEPFLHDLVAVQMNDSHAFALGTGVIPIQINADGTLAALTSQPIPAGVSPTSLSLWLAPTIGTAPSDLDGDGDVDGLDLAILLGQWGACRAACPADLNKDGVVNGFDLAMLLAEWG